MVAPWQSMRHTRSKRVGAAGHRWTIMLQPLLVFRQRHAHGFSSGLVGIKRPTAVKHSRPDMQLVLSGSRSVHKIQSAEEIAAGMVPFAAQEAVLPGETHRKQY